MDYIDSELDIICFSDEYRVNHWKVFKQKKDKEKINDQEFSKRLFNYLWTPKVSELLIILYLEDLNGINPTIYQANKLLKRTSEQYSATYKCVSKLEELDIVYTKPIKDSNLNEKQIFINKYKVTIYGDDEFRQKMLDEWDTDAK